MIELPLSSASDALAVGETLHSSPGRLRVRVRGLLHDRAAAVQLASALRSRPEIDSAEASPVTGTLLVRFKPELSSVQVSPLVLEAVKGRLSAPVVDAAPSLRQRLRKLRKLRAPKSAPVSQQNELRPSSEPWHTFSVEQTLGSLAVQKTGLSPAEAHLRLQRTGPNVLPPPKTRSVLLLLWEQVRSIPVLLLLGSAGFSFATGGLVDGAVITAVVLTNAIIGFATERNAERTIATLTTLAEPQTLVMRGGRVLEIDAAELTVGDILPLTRGAYIPADARLLETRNLTVAESSLTGESAPVTKGIEPVGQDTPLADRLDMVYRGTVITGGSGLAVVIATGARTEIGLVHQLINEASRPQTPMERQLDSLGRQTAYGAIGVCALALLLGALRGFTPGDTVRAAISLAVAALPEGLPAMATTALAFGMRRMRKQNVLARNLGAVEAAGGVDVLCLDKTGTLTVNRMTAVEVVAAGQRMPVSPRKALQASDAKEKTPHLDMLLAVCALCSEASVKGEAQFEGSATEVALLELAAANTINVQTLRTRFPRVELQDRAEDRHYMVTIHTAPDNRRLVAVKGSPEQVLRLCTRRADASGLHGMGRGDRARVVSENHRLASQGRRVLGFAYAESAAGEKTPLNDLVWLGLVALADPPREGAQEALAALRRAGISTRMITGDQGATAEAIGREIGMWADGDSTGIWDAGQLGHGAEADLQSDLHAEVIERSRVFARVTPSHKLDIVQALQKSGHVVAMTGDGVNDGPALKAADIGIALGEGSTETARESADLILRDDDLRGLLVALREGRTVHRNIRQAVRFIIATNLSEVLSVLTAVALGFGQPISPRQLLWLNLVTDIFPVLALAVEPPDPAVLEGPPPPNDPIIARRELPVLAAEAGAIAGSVGLSFAYAMRRYGIGAEASTITFLTLSTAQLLHTLAERPGSVARAPGRNNYVPAAVLGSFALQGITMFTPLGSLLGLTPLALADFGVCLGAVTVSSLATYLLRRFTGPVHGGTSTPRLTAPTGKLLLPASTGDAVPVLS